MATKKTKQVRTSELTDVPVSFKVSAEFLDILREVAAERSVSVSKLLRELAMQEFRRCPTCGQRARFSKDGKDGKDARPVRTVRAA